MNLHPLDWQHFERFYRANLLNSISGFKSVRLIATRDKQGRSNLGVFSNIVHLGADPFLLAYVNRPREAAPHTLANIEATGSYTINHIHEAILTQAHQCSAKYAEGESEFDKTGLTEESADGIFAPYVKESRIKMALKPEEIIPIRHNGTWLVIGSVQEIRIEEQLVKADGFAAIEEAGSLCSLGLDAYYKATPVQRLPYAKP